MNLIAEDVEFVVDLIKVEVGSRCFVNYESFRRMLLMLPTKSYKIYYSPHLVQPSRDLSPSELAVIMQTTVTLTLPLASHFGQLHISIVFLSHLTKA